MNEKLTITIEFDNLKSANFSVQASGNVLPYQLLLLAHYFEFEGKSMLARIRELQLAQELQNQQPKIATLDQNPIIKPL